MSMSQVKGAPISQPTAPNSRSSHTGTTKKGIISRLYKDLSSMFLISTPVGPMKKENVPDVKKPNELFALRGTTKAQPITQGPSNMMAGTPPPKPLKGAPQPPGGNAPAPPSMMGGGGPSMGGSGPMGGGATGPKTPGALPTPGRPLPGVPPGSRIECKKDKCKFTTSPSSTIQGIISMTIPVDTSNKPVLSQIKDISFIPGNAAAATLGVPITKTNTIVVKTKEDGTKVAIKKLDNGKVVQLPGTIVKQTLPNGKVIEVRKTPDGRTISVRPTPKPASAQPVEPRFFGPKRAPGPGTYVKQGPLGTKTTITVKPDGTKVIVKKNVFGGTTTKVVAPPPPPPKQAPPPPPPPPKQAPPPQQQPVKTYIRRGPFGRTRVVQVQPDGSKLIYVRDRRGRVIRVIRR